MDEGICARGSNVHIKAGNAWNSASSLTLGPGGTRALQNESGR